MDPTKLIIVQSVFTFCYGRCSRWIESFIYKVYPYHVFNRRNIVFEFKIYLRKCNVITLLKVDYLCCYNTNTYSSNDHCVHQIVIIHKVIILKDKTPYNKFFTRDLKAQNVKIYSKKLTLVARFIHKLLLY